MRAKSFFYVTLGILALAFHLGASTAGAQSSVFRVLGVNYVGVGGDVYVFAPSLLGWAKVPSNELPPVPASSLVEYQGQFAITAAGEGWVLPDIGAAAWVSKGFVPGAATPTTPTTFGALKAKYR